MNSTKKLFFLKNRVLLVNIFLIFFIYSFNIFAQNTTQKHKMRHYISNKTQHTQTQLVPTFVFPVGDLEARLNTSAGKIVLDLYKTKDPLSVNHFVRYAQEGFYNGLIFHRIVDGFLIQAGAYDINFLKHNGKYPPIKNQSKLGLKNLAGTIAMARKPSDIDSANTQFFINVFDNDYLNYKDGQAGYTVFGKVVSGMDIVNKISRLKVGQREGMIYIPSYPQEALIRNIFITQH